MHVKCSCLWIRFLYCIYWLALTRLLKTWCVGFAFAFGTASNDHLQNALVGINRVVVVGAWKKLVTDLSGCWTRRAVAGWRGTMVLWTCMTHSGIDRCLYIIVPLEFWPPGYQYISSQAFCLVTPVISVVWAWLGALEAPTLPIQSIWAIHGAFACLSCSMLC